MAERRMIVVGYEHAELLDIACVTTTLAMANAIGALRPGYRISVAAPGGRPITCDSGLTLQVQETLEKVTGPFDTLIISGGLGHQRAADDPALVAHVRRLARESRRVASVCTGASVLAAAGLLDGHRATTHWRFAGQLAARYKAVTVDPDPIFIRDGRVVTAAGVTSALDVTLAFIEEDYGAELARQVARDLVTYLQRPGNQAQMSVYTSPPPPENHVVRQAAEFVLAHLDGDLTNLRLAEATGVSVRHLTRLFLDHVGQTPGRYVHRARMEAAARLLATTALPMPDVAARCGMGTAETLRQAFVATYGLPPTRYRATQSTRRPD
ncbi:GlxA family transcriptional regulator [Kribbella sp. NPDC050124]|uniref:GlxA family transcriptional regulator n=1 Tax=Kribbella sp. NPDC050124 TaxID=3364114 RepID=UPI00379B0B03